MKYCSKCGKELMDEAVVCPGCGCSQENKPAQSQNTADASSFGFGLLGFCIPIAGFILYLVWKSNTPLKAKSAGIGALIGFILGLIGYIIYAVIIGAALGLSGM